MIDNHASSIRLYGVTLVRMDSSHLELVRGWGNSDFVREQMVYQEIISPEQQQAWFSKLDPLRDFYYVIFSSVGPVRLVNIKEVSAASGEGGVFVGEPSYLGGTLGMQAMLAMYDFGFSHLGLQVITATILSSNRVAERMNRAIGFLPSSTTALNGPRKWDLTKERFFQSTTKLRRHFSASHVRREI